MLLSGISTQHECVSDKVAAANNTPAQACRHVGQPSWLCTQAPSHQNHFISSFHIIMSSPQHACLTSWTTLSSPLKPDSRHLSLQAGLHVSKPLLHARHITTAEALLLQVSTTATAPRRLHADSLAQQVKELIEVCVVAPRALKLDHVDAWHHRQHLCNTGQGPLGALQLELNPAQLAGLSCGPRLSAGRQLVCVALWSSISCS